MSEEEKLIVEGEDGQQYALVERALLEIRDPETEQMRSILVLEDEDGQTLFFEMIDDETVEQVVDPELIELLSGIDLSSL